MEITIEKKIVTMLTTALIDEQVDNWPAHIERYMDDYDDVNDYPIIVVNCGADRESSMQIGGYTKDYDLYIIIVTVDEDYDIVTAQRSTIKKRIETMMRNNIFLDHVVDTETNEKVQYSRYNTNENSVGGLLDDWETIARMHYVITTERTQPFV